MDEYNSYKREYIYIYIINVNQNVCWSIKFAKT